MKVALIGVGRWGKVLQGELSKLTEIKYACDSKFDLNQVWNDSEVEAIFIATPTQTHFDIAVKALESSKHVFLEKPGTDSSEKLEKLVKLAKEKNLKFAIGYEFPHNPASKKLKELVSCKEVKSIHFEWFKWGTFKDDAVMHLLCHDISIMKYLGFEDLSPINYQQTRVISDTDIISIKFKNTQGAHIKSVINRVNPIKQKTITVLLDNGGYIVSNNDLFSINTDAQSLDKIELPEITPVSAELSDFLNSIKENREPQSSGQFALEVFKIVEQVRT